MLAKKSIIIGFSLSLVVSRIISVILINIYDDAFITFRYADNLANGNGFVYNPGEWVLGVTTPAFGLIISLFSFIGIGLPTASIVLNILLDILILVTTIYFLYQSEKLFSVIFFSLLYISSPIVSRICVGGMEMNLFLILSIVVFWFYSKEKKYPAFILAGFLYFVRPEAILIITVLTIDEIISVKSYKVLGYLLCSSLIILIPSLFIYQFYGQLLPQSVIAKAGSTDRNLYRFLSKLIFNDFICLISIPLTVIGYLKIKTFPKFFRLLGVWALLIILSYFISGKIIWTWYGAPIHFIFFIFAAFGVELIIDTYSKKKLLHDSMKLLIISSILLPILFWGFILLYKDGNPVEKNIYTPLKEFFLKNGINKNHTIYANDIGVIGYYSNSYIYDSELLVSDVASDFKTPKEMLIKLQPDYLFLNLNRYNINMINSKELKMIYKPIRRFAKSGGRNLYFNPKALSDNWIQDYILYEKIK